MSIIHSFDPNPQAIINPEQALPKFRKLDVVIVNFSYKIMNALLEENLLEPIENAQVKYVSCVCQMYVFKGTDIGVIQTQVGAPFTAGVLEDAGYGFDCKHFILFGSCGGLDKELTAGRLIVPTHAYRDEGTSYHYVPPADYIEVKNHGTVAAVLDALSIPYITGRTWTTDAFFRETRRNMAARKAEGCIAVEMEIAACQAVCDFRGYQLYPFLYTADNLGQNQWSEGILSKISIDERLTHFYIALEIAKYIKERERHE